MTEEGKP